MNFNGAGQFRGQCIKGLGSAEAHLIFPCALEFAPDSYQAITAVLESQTLIYYQDLSNQIPYYCPHSSLYSSCDNQRNFRNPSDIPLLQFSTPCY